MIRAGCGFDAHAFCEGRKLILGGVEIPNARGLQGHSDADIIAHAVSDALLGALAMGDIGEHFPDTDPQHKDANSINLLAQLAQKARAAGATIINADATIALQSPRIAPYKNQMRANIAEALSLPQKRVSVKATTTEQLGFVGREEGAAAFAVVTVDDGE